MTLESASTGQSADSHTKPLFQCCVPELCMSLIPCPSWVLTLDPEEHDEGICEL